VTNATDLEMLRTFAASDNKNINIMNRISRFIQTGFSTWASAACGNYRYGSDEIRAMEKEIFSRDYSLRGDRASMAKDRDNVRKDMKKAFQQVKPELWPLSN
jgi:hypothetical protein